MIKLRLKLIPAVILILIIFSFPSPGFAQNSGVEAFVTRFYVLCLGRQPDSAGLDNWVSHLESGRLAGADVAQRFVFSEEFLDRDTSNYQFLNIMYGAFFNRPPDPEGYSGWLSQLQNGKGRAFVLAGFINSAEFAQLCKAYGIEPGSAGGSLDSPGTTEGPVTGSGYFIDSIMQALGLLKSAHPGAYSQLGQVAEIREGDLSGYRASAMADINSRVISVDLASFSGFGENDRIKIIAATLSHELNHIANSSLAGSMSVAAYEELALIQELETCRAIGAPRWYIDHIEAALEGIYDSSTWWWSFEGIAA
ncbi:MAG: DUF4214 domain-containing protein [Actinomycetota bacterium]